MLATQGLVDLGALSSEKSEEQRPAARRVTSKLTGTLVWCEQGRVVVAWLDDARVLLDSADTTAGDREAVARALRLPCRIERSEKDALRSVAFAPQAPSAVRQLWRTLLSLIQCTRGAGAAWTATEDDLTGTLQVAYRKRAGTIEKRILSVQGESASMGKATPTGVMRYVFDSRGLVRAFGERTLALLLDQKEFSRSAVQLQLTRVATTPRATLPSVAVGPKTPLSAQMSLEARAAAIHRAALGKATPESLKAALLASEQAGEKFNEGELYVALRALFVLQPRAAEGFLETLGAAKVGGRVLRILTGALSAAGTEAAQKTLVASVRARLKEPEFVQAVLPTLVEQSQWTTDAEALVVELSQRGDDLGKMATYLIGSAVHAIGTAEPARSDRLLAALLGRLEQGDADEKRLVLGALGNAGVPKTVPRLLPFLTDGDPQTRAEAADALRLIVTEETTARLSALLRSDPTPLVRRQVAVTLGFRPLTAGIRAVLTQAQEKDPDEGVRAAAAETLKRAR